ncbi:MAG: putative beta-lactamase class [Moraxellaceae bacterium]|nr:putative beta-lactamase class [Moraxellaceae bacterium]
MRLKRFLVRLRRAVPLLTWMLVLLVLTFSFPLLNRIHKAETLFNADTISWNFAHMAEIFRSVKVPAAPLPRPLPRGETLQLPEQFRAFGSMQAVAQFLLDTRTDGLIVLQDGRVVFEQYRRGHHAKSRHISWSLAKSMISALVGAAIHEGRIKDIMDPVERYAPALKGTAYEGVPLKAVLQMSSGVRFDENYDNKDADVVRLARTLVLGGSFNAYAKKLKRTHAPGTQRQYSSFDTQVLAMVLQGASGLPLAEYMREKLWLPLGAEQDGAWLVDSEGMVMGFGGFNATLRDYARFGQLYLDNGFVEGRPVVPAEWIAASLAMDAPHLQPQRDQRNDFGLGYGYQWWIPEDGARDYMAMGVYNQFIYVAPATRTVIVKLSSNDTYTAADYLPNMQHLALFRAIAAAAVAASPSRDAATSGAAAGNSP